MSDSRSEIREAQADSESEDLYYSGREGGYIHLDNLMAAWSDTKMGATR